MLHDCFVFLIFDTVVLPRRRDVLDVRQNSCFVGFHTSIIWRQVHSSFDFREVTGDTDLLPGVSGAIGGHSAWLQGLKSPLIKEDDEGSKELKLRFDVSEYAPEEIMVKTVDNKLLVHAKHEENGGGKSVYREYNREFLLPQGTNPELIKSSLSKVAF